MTETKEGVAIKCMKHESAKNELRIRIQVVEMKKLKIVLVGDLKNSKSCRLRILDGENKHVCMVRVKVLEGGKIGWWTSARNLEKAINNSPPIDGTHIYRILRKPGCKGKIMKTLEDCIRKGVGELEVLRCRLSVAEKIFWRALVKNGLKFKLKRQINDCIIDFYINADKDCVLIKIIRNSEEYKEILEKVKKLTEEGRIFYLLMEEEVLKHSSELIKKILAVISKEMCFPNGLLTRELRLNKPSPPIEILVTLQNKKDLVSGKKKRFMKIFMVRSSKQIFLTEERMAKDVWNFAKRISNILAGYGYFHDAHISKYMEIFDELKKFKKAKFTVYILPDYSKSEKNLDVLRSGVDENEGS